MGLLHGKGKENVFPDASDLSKGGETVPTAFLR